MFMDYLWQYNLLRHTQLLLLMSLTLSIGGDMLMPQISKQQKHHQHLYQHQHEAPQWQHHTQHQHQHQQHQHQYQYHKEHYWNTTPTGPLSLSLSSAITYAQPYFDNTTRREVTTTVGQMALLHCRVRNLGDRAVSWIRKRDLHILTVGILTYTNDQRFQTLHVDGTDEWSLCIKSVQKRDTGTYECQISTEPKISKAFRLAVVVSKAKILGNTELFIKNGSNINLTCIATQTPVPPTYIYWYKGKRVMNYSERGGIQVITERTTRTSHLLITKATSMDTGNYTCAPSSSDAASVVVHVINDGEHPAAMQHGNTTLSTLNTFTTHSSSGGSGSGSGNDNAIGIGSGSSGANSVGSNAWCSIITSLRLYVVQSVYHYCINTYGHLTLRMTYILWLAATLTMLNDCLLQQHHHQQQQQHPHSHCHCQRVCFHILLTSLLITWLFVLTGWWYSTTTCCIYQISLTMLYVILMMMMMMLQLLLLSLLKLLKRVKQKNYFVIFSTMSITTRTLRPPQLPIITNVRAFEEECTLSDKDSEQLEQLNCLINR